MKEYELAETIHDTVDCMCLQVVDHYDAEDYDSANAILNEWTLSDNGNLLTKHLQHSMHTVSDKLIYMAIEYDELAYGEFEFTGDQLPIDNN